MRSPRLLQRWAVPALCMGAAVGLLTASLAFGAPVVLSDVSLTGGGQTVPEGGVGAVWDIDNPLNAMDQCAVFNQPAVEINATFDGSTDIFDGGVSFVVGTKAFYDSDNMAEATSTKVTAGPESFGPLKGTLVHEAFDDEGVLRSTLSLKNNSDTTQTRYLVFDSAHGTDLGTRMTQDGDLAWERSDRWVMFSDLLLPNRPYVAYALQGKGRPASPLSNIIYRPWDFSVGEGQFCATVDYKVRVPAGATRHLVIFTMLIDEDRDLDGALTEAKRFNGTSLDLWRGMSAGAKAKVVNWDL